MACDCAGNRIPTTLPSAVNHVIPPPVRSFIQHRDRAALAISGSPAHHPLSYLILLLLFRPGSFFLIPFAEDESAVVAFQLSPPIETDFFFSAFSHAVVFSREADF